MNRPVPLFLLALSLLPLACNKAGEKDAPWVIKTYKTDSSQNDATVKTLNKLLNVDPVKSWVNKGDHSEEVVAKVEQSRGVARAAGAGLIAVNTSETLHAGIPELIAQISQAKAKPLTEMQTEGWLLAALPSPQKIPLPEALKDKLEAFDRAYPGHCIVEIDHFQVRAVEGKEFQLKGDLAKVTGYTMFAGDKILGDLEFDGKLIEFKSQITFKPGEALVVSQASRHAKTLPKGILEKCGLAAETPLDIHTLVALKASQVDSK